MKIYLSKPAVFSAAGKNAEELWTSLIKGDQSGIKRCETFSGSTFFAARIDEGRLQPSTGRFDMKIIRIEEAALRQMEDLIEKAKEKYGEKRIAVCVGSCDNGTEFSLAGHRKYFENGAFSEDYSIEMQGADYVSTFISEKYSLSGPVCTFSTACSSSAGAIIKAAELIKSGICDAAVAGGIDIASDTTLDGFNSLEAISEKITNPFSKNRSGITLGDGAAFFVLSKEPLDDSFPAITLLGYGESCDAHHITSPDPSGIGAKKAIEKALINAKITPGEVDYVNLHGTGTKFNDSMEAKALAAVFGSNKVHCSTTKPITGHTLGAAGALELAVCCMAIAENLGKSEAKLPPQIWDGVFDEEMPKLNFISKNSNLYKQEINICISNSFAFGGANACLVVAVAPDFCRNKTAFSC
ncbi:3-oxoacyl-ACP synthase [bacterium]|nr:3-oxoacyl-ACP synthase [bacterium]